MSIIKDEIEEKNQEIDRLRATIVEKGKQQESTWATGSWTNVTSNKLYNFQSNNFAKKSKHFEDKLKRNKEMEICYSEVRNYFTNFLCKFIVLNIHKCFRNGTQRDCSQKDDFRT